VIQINLLPEDLRKHDGTPLPRRIAIYAGTAALTGLLFMVAIQRMKTLPDLVSERDRVAKDLQAARERIEREIRPLQKVMQGLERRKRVLAQIEPYVLRWAPRLDTLQDTLVTELPGVWLTGLSFEETQPKARAGAKGATALERRLTLTFAASDFTPSKDLFSMSNEDRITEVVRRLSRRTVFSQDLIGVTAHSWTMTDDYAKPPWGVKAITFPVTFLLRPPPVEAPSKPAPAAAPAGAEKKTG
jgi:hypothetical protein